METEVKWLVVQTSSYEPSVFEFSEDDGGYDEAKRKFDQLAPGLEEKVFIAQVWQEKEVITRNKTSRD